ncbi:HNH endonuclease [Clostridium kluyveri]|uniref:Putative HNH nuclease YajD n=1 Tax=Clostridium kluyveri TaxID=1534 RepID=A0A1L5F8R9_CLOKL|nr:HNH endonuclease [Clostridium kluyveri]APM39408.1 restriction endonuclease [Clostridium kluyveri]
MARHNDIYKAKEWEKVRGYVIGRANGLCERCKAKGKIVPGKIVHHKVWLTDKNKKDWDIAYNPDNLEYLCNPCHEEVHERVGTLKNFVEPVK